LVNFFSLRDEARLVDLPGYGFARVSESVREHWGQLLTAYIEDRGSLHGLFLIVDIRRGLSDYDRQLMQLAEPANLSVHVLLTKADKLKRGQAANALMSATKELKERATVQLFSALNRQGVEQARDMLEQLLGEEAPH
jgi:GTP-binding protein